MQKQIVFTEEEYEEIQLQLAEYEKLKELQAEYDALTKNYEALEDVVKAIFKDEEIFYRETTTYHRNQLFLNSRALSILFNHYFEEEFFKQSGLKVDDGWNFK